jgi:hypothetical protein
LKNIFKQFLTYAFALGAVVGGISETPAGVLELARRWHGNIENQFSAYPAEWRGTLFFWGGAA